MPTQSVEEKRWHAQMQQAFAIVQELLGNHLRWNTTGVLLAHPVWHAGYAPDFDLDSIRIPYQEETKKARSRSIFVGKKWLEVGYNPKDLWSVSRLHRIHAEREDHPTQKPLEIIERMVKASCPENGIVLDPFAGTGTTAVACLLNNRRYITYELNPQYYELILNRIRRNQDFFLEPPKIDETNKKEQDKQQPLFFGANI